MRMSPVDPGERPAEEAPGLDRRRAAVAELGRELRALVDAAVSTEVETEHLERGAVQVRALTEVLRGRVRERHVPAGVDDLRAGVRMYNPVSGVGSPLAPPLHLEMAGGSASGECTLGLAYEGPPSYGHGGVSALLIDQVLGGAAAASGNPGMTVELTVRYRRPVPLREPLLIRGTTVDVSGRWVRATGSIAAAEEPERVLVEAEATFATLNSEQARRLFPA
jgi:hypothetical protein